MPTPTATRSAAAYAEDAARLFQEGKLSSSIELYRKAIRVAPKNADLYTALARVQIFSRDSAGALENAQNAVLRSPNAMTYAVLGWAYYQNGDLARARELLNKSKTMDPTLALTRAYLAFVIIDDDINNWKAASEEAKESVRISKDLLESHMAYAYVLMNTANYLEAIDELDLAIASHANLSALYIMLGDCYRGIGDATSAIDAYTAAAARDPQDPDPPARIARTYYGIGQWGKALQYAKNAVQNAILEPRMHGLLGVMYFRNQEYESAAQELRLATAGGRVLDAEGKDLGMIQGLPLEAGVVGEYYWTYALTLVRLDRCAEAVPILQMLRQGIPEDILAQENVTAGLLSCQVITPTPTYNPNR